MEVFPAFDLPMISTLNWIFGTRVGRRGAGDRAGDGAGAGDGGEGSGAGAGVGAGAGAKAGDRAGDDAAGGGRGDGTRQQILCFTPIARKCCEKKDGVAYVDHSSEFRPLLLYTQYGHQLTGVFRREGTRRFISPITITNITCRNPRVKSGAIRTTSVREVVDTVRK